MLPIGNYNSSPDPERATFTLKTQNFELKTMFYQFLVKFFLVRRLRPETIRIIKCKYFSVAQIADILFLCINSKDLINIMLDKLYIDHSKHLEESDIKKVI